MKYQKINNKNYNIHVINNNKFHTIIISISFTENVNRELVTYRNTLTNVLTMSCKKYDERCKIVNKSKELYSIIPRASVIRYGNLLETSFTISIANGMFTNKKIIKENIDFLWEIILNPLAENNKFNKKIFELAKNDEKLDRIYMEEDPVAYSCCKAIELSNTKDNYSILSYSNQEILNTINEENLYSSYINMLKNSKIDIFLSGNIRNSEDIIDYIKNKFIFKNTYSLNKPYIIHNKTEKEKYLKENKKYEQSKLSILLKTYNLNKFENKYVYCIYRNILGGDYSSILMNDVRMDKSLVYYIFLEPNKLDNFMMLNCGISKNNYDEVIKCIKKCLLKMKNGDFTTNMLNNAKKEYLNSLKNAFNYNENYINYFYGIEILNSDDIKTRKDKIRSITKKDIINFSKKIKIDTIYFLEGEL